MRTTDADALLEMLNHMVFTSDLTTTVAVGMARKWIEDAPTVEPGMGIEVNQYGKRSTCITNTGTLNIDMR